MKRILAVAAAVALLLSACGGAGHSEASEPAQSSVVSTSPAASSAGIPSSRANESQVSPASMAEEEAPPEPAYIETVVQQTIAKFSKPDMTETEKAKAAFDYLIETTSFEPPVCQDIWRIRGGAGEIPSYEETRALSVLLFGLGYCEDYASALTLLLQGMGMQAVYVPGLTYSFEGHLVDHAWTIAKVDGVWYHLDSQLEDDITKNNTVTYRYFMKGDDTMRASHFWGQNLIDSGLLTIDQNIAIGEGYLAPHCPQDYICPTSTTIKPVPTPDIPTLVKQLEEEYAAYEAEHGPLEAIELNNIPPVFGNTGYGPYTNSTG